MAKMYDNPIDETIPWDGNESTGNLPVKGSRIEEFLKSQLQKKGMSEAQKEQLSESIKDINVSWDAQTKGLVLEYEKHNTPPDSNPSIPIPCASEQYSGLMSYEDKKKLKELSESIDINPITDEEIKNIFNKS